MVRPRSVEEGELGATGSVAHDSRIGRRRRAIGRAAESCDHRDRRNDWKSSGVRVASRARPSGPSANPRRTNPACPDAALTTSRSTPGGFDRFFSLIGIRFQHLIYLTPSSFN